jgi:mannose-6-phosphate isomerase-like protein (cupin superfamily)
MKSSFMVVGMAATLAVLCSIGFVQGQETQPTREELNFVSADEAKFKELAPGVTQAILWGEREKGPYGAFTKFVPGHDDEMHTHTNDIWIVGIKGAYLYKDDAGEKRVGPGSFIRIPGGKKHWSGGDTKEGALFYEESSGKFDMVPAK